MQTEFISITQPLIFVDNRQITAEELIVHIARVSSSRTNTTEEPEKLINYLIKNRHWSPFEMVNMCVKIVTSKAISIQLLRHRSFSFQEFSQRYAKVENFEPIELRQQAETNRQSSTDVFDPIINLPTIDESSEDYSATEAIGMLLNDIKTVYTRLLDADRSNISANAFNARPGTSAITY